MYILLTYIMIIMLGILGLCINYYYFLMSLLIMEFIMVFILGLVLFSVYGMGHYILFLLILGICEGVLGLMSIILVYRYFGSDMYTLVDYDIC